MTKFLVAYYAVKERFYVSEYNNGDYVRDFGPFKTPKDLLQGICRRGHHKFTVEFEASSVNKLAGLKEEQESKSGQTLWIWPT